MNRGLIVGGAAMLTLGLLLTVDLPHDTDPAFAAGTPSCTDHQLTRDLSADTHDATDRYRYIVLTNTGGRCTLQGRPAVSLEHHGEQVGVRGDYFPYSPTGGKPKTRPLTLGHRASAEIWLAVAVAGSTKCHKQPIDGFLLRLSHHRAQPVTLPASQRRRYTVCASRSSHELAFSQFLPVKGR